MENQPFPLLEQKMRWQTVDKLHKAVCKEIHIIDHQAMVHHIDIEQNVLENIGLKTNCLIVPHKDKEIAEAIAPEEDCGDIGTTVDML